MAESAVSPGFSSVDSKSIVCSESSSSSCNGIIIVVKTSDEQTVSQVVLLSNVQVPASFQLQGVLNDQFIPFEVGMGNPKELYFVDLGALLSALTCSLVLLGS